MSIVRLFDLDVAPLVALMPEFDHLWEEDRWRQTMPFTPHRDSQSIYLRRQPGSRPRDVIYQLAVIATRHYCHAPLAETIDAVCRQADGRAARALLVRLLPGGIVSPHTDGGPYAEATERYHIPIITNPDAWLEVDGQRFHLEPGACYAFDKHSPHHGANEGVEARVHLIVDVFPEAGEVYS